MATLKARAPERFDVLEFLPGEEAQVDYGQGALTRHPTGNYKRPYLFVMTLKYSGKSFDPASIPRTPLYAALRLDSASTGVW